MCPPIGREAGLGLLAVSRRPDFPTDREQTLLRVTTSGRYSDQRSKSEAQVVEKTRDLELIKETETALYTFTDRLFRAELEHEIYEAGKMQFSASCVAIGPLSSSAMTTM